MTRGPDERPSALLGTSWASLRRKELKKLVELVKEINRILIEEREAMLLDKSVKAAD